MMMMMMGLAWSSQPCSTFTYTTLPAGDYHPLYSCFHRDHDGYDDVNDDDDADDNDDDTR